MNNRREHPMASSRQNAATRVWLIVAGCAALAGCKQPSSSKRSTANAPAADPHDNYTFYCISRVRATDWDGKFNATVRAYSTCTRDRALCEDLARTPPVTADAPNLTASTPCLESAHAFCFAFVDPSATPTAQQEQIHAWLKDGISLVKCKLSWHECHEEWLGHYELARFGEKGSLEYEQAHTKTDCRLY
jgi:hypothetical protein